MNAARRHFYRATQPKHDSSLAVCLSVTLECRVKATAQNVDFRLSLLHLADTVADGQSYIEVLYDS